MTALMSPVGFGNFGPKIDPLASHAVLSSRCTPMWGSNQSFVNLSFDPKQSSNLNGERFSSIISDESVQSGDSESESSSDQDEAALKVSFFVRKGHFHFKDPSLFRQKGYEVTESTIFFQVGFVHTNESLRYLNYLGSLPASLVKKVLTNQDKPIQITWEDREIELHFIEKEEMNKQAVLSRVDDLKGSISRPLNSLDEVANHEVKILLPRAQLA